MRSRWTGFRSPLAAGIETFLAHKRALGCRFRNEESPLRLLDQFLVEQHVETIETITPQVIDTFLVSRPRAAPHSYNLGALELADHVSQLGDPSGRHAERLVHRGLGSLNGQTAVEDAARG